ncbi:MAG: aldehyde dehydrogenase family protein [Bdellovibrionales bacterium]
MIESNCLINGSWQVGKGELINKVSPHDGRTLGRYSVPNGDQIAQALDAATRAQKEWSARPIKERSVVLFRLREILLRDLDKISEVKSAESGKIAAEGRAGLLKGIEVLEFATSIQNLDLGGRSEVSRGVRCEYRRVPLGVVTSLTPFNFPAMVPLWTMPIAIVLGNAYVWKPSEKTPLTAALIGEAWREAGLPAGILTILHGAESTAEALLRHPSIKAVAFVGSTKIAKHVYQVGSQAGKRVLALGGAKNHIILLPDASPQLSGPAISDSFTGCAGQRCMAASVLLAVGDVDAHIEKIVERARSLRLGQDMGAIISPEQKKFLLGAIDRAVKAGAKILLDGRSVTPPAGAEGGNWLGPTILDNVKPGSEAAVEELFGPVLSIVRCQTLDEALSIQATSEYGNACSVFTANGALAERVASQARAGMIGVNVGVPVPREPYSFGGVQNSKFGHGDITGHSSLDFWTDLKKITVKWESQTDSTWMG